MTRVAAVVLGVAAAATAAVLLNLVLLGRASGATDHVGRLQPLAHVPTTAPPPGTIRPTRDEHRDDHGAHDSDDD